MIQFQEIAPEKASAVMSAAAENGQRLVIPVVYTVEDLVCINDRDHVRGKTRWRLPKATPTPKEFTTRFHNSIALVLDSEVKKIFGNSRTDKAEVTDEQVSSLGLVGSLPPTAAWPTGTCVLPHLVEFNYPAGDNRLKRCREFATIIGALKWVDFDQALVNLVDNITGQDDTPSAIESLAIYAQFLKNHTEFAEHSPQPQVTLGQMTSA